MQKPLSKSKHFFLDHWPELLFLLSLAASVITTYYVSKNIFDSDASSEMVLGNYLANTTDFIVSKDWFYSSEIRILHTPLVYSALFHFFSDWSFVRFFGAMILQMILLISYGYILHQSGFGRKAFFLGSALLLLPVSVTHGHIVLYHSHYVPNLAMSFLLIGLTLEYAAPVNWKHRRPWILLAVLLLFSFIGGLTGVRQLLITHAPLLVCITALYFLEDSRQANPEKSSFLLPGHASLFAVSLLSAFFSFLGLLVNTTVLSQIFSFEHQTEYRVGFLKPSELGDLAYGFFHQFGFREGHSMLSLMGILSIAGIFAGCYCVFLTLQYFFHHTKSHDIRKSIVQIFSVCVAAINIFIFIISGKYYPYHYVLYLVIIFPWAILLLTTDLIHLPRNLHFLRAKKLLAVLTILILFANGYVNVLYFNGNPDFQQRYEGLCIQEKDKVSTMKDVSNFILDNGYDIGYATYWNNNILTEITDGRIRMVNVVLLPDIAGGSIVYHNWLCFFSFRELDAEKPFMLIENKELEDFARTDAYQHCSLVYSDAWFSVFDVLNEDAIKVILNEDV